MKTRQVRATFNRVLKQLMHDHRSIALVIGVPTLLMGLLAWVYGSHPGVFNSVGGRLLGVFPLIMMFLITSVTTLRERTSGTLERLMTLPIGKAQFITGYSLAFGVLAIMQSVIVSLVSIYLFGLEIHGSILMIVLIALVDAILGTALGLAASSLARTEFQAVQMMPIIILPQIFISGLLVPREDLPHILKLVSNVMPLSYAIDATNIALQSHNFGGQYLQKIFVVGLITIGVLVVGAVTLPRQSK